ncbi:MAG: RNA polymerase sigma factor (sigma-70 family) [Pirellulaceae bacterium]|jgi:RNA polymerase sigma factor (sigma-70 family)
MGSTDSDRLPAERSYFATTHWTLVCAAGSPDSPQYKVALEMLCRAYWYPLYAFLRRDGHGAHDAQDYTQEFLAELLSRNDLGRVVPGRGKFRSFLLVAMKNFLIRQRERRNALKRGGGQVITSIDFGVAEDRYGREPASGMTPDAIFQRRWALDLLERVVRRLEDEYTALNKGKEFAQLKQVIVPAADQRSYRDIGENLGISEGAVKVSAHRVRKRYRELLREEVGHTVSDPAQVEEEITDLIKSLAG